jgi:hypothetical protein
MMLILMNIDAKVSVDAARRWISASRDLTPRALLAIATLFLLGGAAEAWAQRPDPATDKRSVPEPADLIQSTADCAYAIVNGQSADDLFAKEAWSIETKSRTIDGKTVETYFAWHPTVRKTIQYWPGIACWVLGDIPHREFDGKIDESRSIGLVVNGAYRRISEQYAVSGFRAGKLNNPILMADRFEIEFTMIGDDRVGGSAYGIQVTPVTKSGDN